MFKNRNGWSCMAIIGILVCFGIMTTADAAEYVVATTNDGVVCKATPAGSWEQKGHWVGAPAVGIAGEIRSANKSPWKYFVFTCDGRMCYKFLKPLSFWPETQAGFDAVTLELLENRWGYLGEIVFDSYPERPDALGEKATVIRYSIN